MIYGYFFLYEVIAGITGAVGQPHLANLPAPHRMGIIMANLSSCFIKLRGAIKKKTYQILDIFQNSADPPPTLGSDVTLHLVGVFVIV